MSESEAARLSRLLFESREIISMFKDMIEIRSGVEDTWSGRIISEIDEYRAERGWSPAGFGGEIEMVDQKETPRTIETPGGGELTDNGDGTYRITIPDERAWSPGEDNK